MKFKRLFFFDKTENNVKKTNKKCVCKFLHGGRVGGRANNLHIHQQKNTKKYNNSRGLSLIHRKERLPRSLGLAPDNERRRRLG